MTDARRETKNCLASYVLHFQLRKNRMKQIKFALFIAVLTAFLFSACQKNPVGSNDEPLEFPDFPDTPE